MSDKPFIVQHYSHGDQRPILMRADRVPMSEPDAAQAFATYDEAWDRIEFFGIGLEGQETPASEFSVALTPAVHAELRARVDGHDDREVWRILWLAIEHGGDIGIPGVGARLKRALDLRDRRTRP